LDISQIRNRWINEISGIQNDINAIMIKLVSTGPREDKDLEKIKQYVRSKLGKEINIDIQVVKDIAPTASGKHRWDNFKSISF
jgi:F0F1-type ATP synthase delta subunit